jgi:hypothetical protein
MTAYFHFGRHAVVRVVEVLRYKPKVTASIPDGVTGILPAALWP